MKRFAVALFMFGALLRAANGDTVIVNEMFDQYADDAAYLAVWIPVDGGGNNPAGVQDASLLTTDDTLYPGIQGKAADHLGTAGANNQYDPPVGADLRPFPGNALIATATQHIFLSYDLFDAASGNERMTLGLRNRTVPNNIIEMGLYNSNSCDPFVEGCGATTAAQNSTPDTPGFYPGTAYGTRTQLINGVNEPLVTTPDWQYFQLPIELDRPDDADELVAVADIGAGWHTYTATIAPDSVTYTIDLFRDGVRNNMRDENGVVVGAGEQGVPDATMTFPVNFHAAGFDSLRIGTPSGVGSAGPGEIAFDNILLSLIDVASPGNTADFNGNGVIDAADYTAWRDNLGLTGTATQSQGDADGDMDVDNDDYNLWKSSFGNSVPGAGSLAAAAGVPEPTTMMLTLCGVAALGVIRRRH